MLVSNSSGALDCRLQHGSLCRGIRNINPKELLIDLLFDAVLLKQVVDIVEINMFRIRAVRLMFLIDPWSAILLMCLVGFVLTWLVTQVGGRLLRPMRECIIVGVVVVVVGVICVWSIGVERRAADWALLLPCNSTNPSVPKSGGLCLLSSSGAAPTMCFHLSTRAFAWRPSLLRGLSLTSADGSHLTIGDSH